MTTRHRIVGATYVDCIRLTILESDMVLVYLRVAGLGAEEA